MKSSNNTENILPNKNNSDYDDSACQPLLFKMTIIMLIIQKGKSYKDIFLI